MSNVDETEKLRARVRALEEELARRDEDRSAPKRVSNKLSDLLKEISDQNERECSKVGRALLLGYAEYLRQTNQVLDEFIEGVDKRDHADSKSSHKKDSHTLTDTVIDELIDAVRSSSTIPQAVIDRVAKAHREESHKKGHREAP